MDWKHYSKSDLNELERIFRLNLINSISGFKPANLIGSKSTSGQTNLAIFSSVVHLGSNPALLGFVMRPTTVERHTYDNIMETGVYTINHVPSSHTAMAHYTSAKFEQEVSEFEACGFTAAYLADHHAPFVAESPIKMAMKLEQKIPIEINGTMLIIGSVEHLYVADQLIEADGALNLERAKTACISGLNTYYEATRLAKYPYARVGEPSKDVESNSN